MQDCNVVIPLSEFKDVTLHMLVSKVLLSCNSLDMVLVQFACDVP